jgi:HK97 family phage major capsid protein
MNNASVKAKIIAEYGQSQKTGKTFSSKTLKAYTYRTDIIPISLELLQDSAFNVEQYIGQLLAEEFIAGLNADFTNGDGSGKPRGITLDAKSVSLAGDGVTYDDIISVMQAVPSGYQVASKFMMNAKTMFELAKELGMNASSFVSVDV